MGRRLSVVGLFTLMACTSNSVTYLLPEGYIGPVFVVFDDQNGEVATQAKGSSEIYRIPPDGVLRLRTTAPAGISTIRFFYVHPDGQLRELPYAVANDTLQAFDHVSGTAEKMEHNRAVTWHAFVVGVPRERSDWIEVRERATFHAIGVSGYPSSYEKRWGEGT
jgi:Family of unknown function (DUF6843)